MLSINTVDDQDYALTKMPNLIMSIHTSKAISNDTTTHYSTRQLTQPELIRRTISNRMDHLNGLAWFPPEAQNREEYGQY